MTPAGAGAIVPLAIPTPFPVGPVNAYLVRSRPLALIDTGPLLPDAEEELRRQLAALGVAVRDLELLLFSHGHVDHTGLARRLHLESGAPVRIHAADAPRLAAPEATLDRFRAFSTGLYRLHGVPEELIRILDQGTVQVWRLAEPVDMAEPLRHDEEIRFADLALRVIHTPGHSAGSVCLHDAASGRLLSGDTLLGKVTPNPLKEPPALPSPRSEGGGPEGQRGPAAEPGFESEPGGALARYLRSLDRLAELTVSEVLPGHGAPFGGAGRVIERIRRHHALRKQRVWQLLQRHGPQTAHTLAGRLWPGLKADAIFLALSEVLGHLELLEGERRVEVRPCHEGREPVCYVACGLQSS